MLGSELLIAGGTPAVKLTDPFSRTVSNGLGVNPGSGRQWLTDGPVSADGDEANADSGTLPAVGWIDCKSTDGTVKITPAYDRCGISFRVKDADNFLYLRLTDNSTTGNNRLRLEKRENGNSTNLDTADANSSGTPGSMKVTLAGSSITVEMDGTQYMQLNESYLKGKEYHGLVFFDSSGAIDYWEYNPP